MTASATVIGRWRHRTLPEESHIHKQEGCPDGGGSWEPVNVSEGHLKQGRSNRLLRNRGVANVYRDGKEGQSHPSMSEGGQGEVRKEVKGSDVRDGIGNRGQAGIMLGQVFYIPTEMDLGNILIMNTYSLTEGQEQVDLRLTPLDCARAVSRALPDSCCGGEVIREQG